MKTPRYHKDGVLSNNAVNVYGLFFQYKINTEVGGHHNQ